MIGAALAVGAAGLAIPASVDAATYTVINRKDSGPGSLRAAIERANANPGTDTVSFASALTGTIKLTTGEIDITDSVTIRGPGATKLIVDGNSSSRIFNIHSYYVEKESGQNNVTISGLTLTRGRADDGGAIRHIAARLALVGVNMLNNIANEDGGALWASGCDLDLLVQNCRIAGNVAGENGGGISIGHAHSPQVIDRTVIANNSAGGEGGGIFFDESDDGLTITRCTISGNIAEDGGGLGWGGYIGNKDDGMYDVTWIEDTVIARNTAWSMGGGVSLPSSDTPVIFNRCTISGNTAGEAGGGVAMDRARAYDYVGLGFADCTISGNMAEDGGGLAFYDADGVIVYRCTIAGNTAREAGGGIAAWHVGGGRVPSAKADGPFWDGFSIYESTLSGNRAGDGAGMFVYDAAGDVEMENSTVSGNVAVHEAGGIFFGAGDSGYLGPVGFTYYGGSLNMRFCTVAGNSAFNVGGIYAPGVFNDKITSGTTVNLENSIVGANSAMQCPDIAGGTFNLQYSLVGAEGCADIYYGEDSLVGVDPMLGALANNGGPTKTMLPRTGSPVINAGDPEFEGDPTTDQRGIARVRLGRVDMGAVER
jgi:hypothetical protein